MQVPTNTLRGQVRSKGTRAPLPARADRELTHPTEFRKNTALILLSPDMRDIVTQVKKWSRGLGG